MNINVFDIVNRFQTELNKDIKNHSTSWSNHISELRKLIDLALTSMPSSRQGLIFGAGNCNDFSLSHLASHFEYKLTLLDLDAKSIKRALENEDIEIKRKTSVIQKDITGLFAAKHSKDLISLAQRSLESEKILNKWLSSDFKICSPYIINKKFQFVMSSTVATQLVASLGPLINPSNLSLVGKLKSFAEKVSDSHVKQIAYLLETGGSAVITSEQYEWGQDEQGNYLPTGMYVSDPKEMLQSTAQNLLEQKNLSLPGRIECEHLTNAGLQILNSSEWIWNLVGNRHYLVKGWVVTKP